MDAPTDLTDLVSVDLAKKRVYVQFRGTLTRAVAEQMREAYREAIAKVGSGYTAVSIFENYVPGTAEVQEVLSSMITMANDAGCRAVARVAQGSVFGQMQLGRLQREVQADYPVNNCETLAEAEAYLDGE